MSAEENPFAAPASRRDTILTEAHSADGAEVPREVAESLLRARPWLRGGSAMAALFGCGLLAALAMTLLKSFGRYSPGTVVGCLCDMFLMAVAFWTAALTWISAGEIAAYARRPSDNRLVAFMSSQKTLAKVFTIAVLLYPLFSILAAALVTFRALF